MITVCVNGESRLVEASLTLADLLQQLELEGKRIAVELNHEIIPRSIFSQTRLRPDDSIEIVHAIGGG